jgi:predicted GNAT family acetyltransferase
MADTPQFQDNPQQHRFEARMGDEVAAQAEYELDGGSIVFTHTIVQPQHEGQGLGSKLAKYALDSARERQLKVVPKCEFIAAYIQRHAQYADLLAR